MIRKRELLIFAGGPIHFRCLTNPVFMAEKTTFLLVKQPHFSCLHPAFLLVQTQYPWLSPTCVLVNHLLYT